MCQLVTMAWATFCQIGAAVKYPSLRVQSTFLPGTFGLRTTTIIVNRGWFAGRKPTKDAHTFSVYLPLTGIWDVPVLPAWLSSKPGTRDVQPDPYCTTACIIAVIFLAVAALTTCR